MRKSTPSVARWHALEIALESDRDRRSPFRDVDVRIELETSGEP